MPDAAEIIAFAKTITSRQIHLNETTGNGHLKKSVTACARYHIGLGDFAARKNSELSHVCDLGPNGLRNLEEN